MNLTSSTTKTCRQCRQSKPLGSFRRCARNRDGRSNQCQTCHAEYERLRRERLRGMGQRREMRFQLNRLRNPESCTEQVCREILCGFGGPDGFAKFWTEFFRHETNRGGAASLRILEATVRLIDAADGKRRSRLRSPVQ